MRWRDSQDDADDELEDDDTAPDETDFDDPDDEPDLIECPACRKSVLEDAERCHHCGHFIQREASRRRVPLWFLITVVIAILIVLMWSL